jgi:hypothetical protein
MEMSEGLDGHCSSNVTQLTVFVLIRPKVAGKAGATRIDN